MESILLSRSARGTVEPVAEELCAALRAEGFTVITRLDLRARLWERLGREVPPALVLVACCPALAFEALSARAAAAALLPCQVALRDAGGGRVSVEAVAPSRLLGAASDERLARAARQAEEALLRALAVLAPPSPPAPEAAPSAIIAPCSTSASPASSPSS